MTRVSWVNNDHEGRGLRRAFDKLDSKLDGIQDIHELTEVIRAMAYVAQIKAGISRTEQLEKRIEELERLAGIAQSGTISQ